MYWYFHTGHGIEFDACGTFPLSDGSGVGKNVIVFVDNSL